jgi:formate transporter
MTEPSGGFDAYTPQQMAARLEAFSEAKVALALTPLALLSVLAGAFIGLGSLFYSVVVCDASLGFAVGRVLGGLVFSLGLILVVVAGAELFTGNNLLAMAWADGRVSSSQVLRNWAVALLGNAVGAAGLAGLVAGAGLASSNGGALGDAVVRIAMAKVSLPWQEAFLRGVLCNLLVCMAVWMSLAGRSVTDKAVAVVFPVAAFVAAGFEHSVANLFFLPLAALWGAPIGLAELTHNLVPVIAGNLVGGSVLVAVVYWLIYVRPKRAAR